MKGSESCGSIDEEDRAPPLLLPEGATSSHSPALARDCASTSRPSSSSFGACKRSTAGWLGSLRTWRVGKSHSRTAPGTARAIGVGKAGLLSWRLRARRFAGPVARMAGMPLFAHAGREKSTPPPRSAPLKLIKFFGSKTRISLIQGAQAPHRAGFCLFCSAKHAKTIGPPNPARRGFVCIRQRQLPDLPMQMHPPTVRPFARDLRVLIGWPFPLGLGLDGRLLLARRGRVYVQFIIITRSPHANSADA